VPRGGGGVLLEGLKNPEIDGRWSLVVGLGR
jgi:hypothetical protein